jgi:hypothetical protein
MVFVLLVVAYLILSIGLQEEPGPGPEALLGVLAWVLVAAGLLVMFEAIRRYRARR